MQNPMATPSMESVYTNAMPRRQRKNPHRFSRRDAPSRPRNQMQMSPLVRGRGLAARDHNFHQSIILAITAVVLLVFIMGAHGPGSA